MSGDPLIPQLEAETARRRRRRMFSHARVPVRMMVPNLFTLFGLCAGLTSIRMSIEGRWDYALAAIVFAAALDGVDGRIARLLKASSRFGAELDSLADFVNFGVAPAILLFIWGFSDVKSMGWIVALVFALGSALRLARFNVALDDDKPKWQYNYFSGMPTPAAAIVVLLPVYLAHVGLDVRFERWLVHGMLLYTLAIALMMVSNIPTYSGKLLGERIGREWVLPLFILAVLFVAHLVTYPYETLLTVSLVYLAGIPLSWRKFLELEQAHASSPSSAPEGAAPAATAAQPAPAQQPTSTTGGDTSRVVEMRPNDKR